MDLKIVDGDMVIVNGEIEWITGAAAIGQHVTMRVQTWLGELGTVYDRSAGLPYLQVIFAGAPLPAVQAIVTQVVLDTPGVQGADLTFDHDNQTRKLTVSGTIQTQDGPVDFEAIAS